MKLLNWVGENLIYVSVVGVVLTTLIYIICKPRLGEKKKRGLTGEKDDKGKDKKKWYTENYTIILVAFVIFNLLGWIICRFMTFPNWWTIHVLQNSAAWGTEIILVVFLLMIPKGTGEIHHKVGKYGAWVTVICFLVAIFWNANRKMDGDYAPYPPPPPKPDSGKVEFDVEVGPEWTKPVELPKNLWTIHEPDRLMWARGDGSKTFLEGPNTNLKTERFEKLEFKIKDGETEKGKVHFSFSSSPPAILFKN